LRSARADHGMSCTRHPCDDRHAWLLKSTLQWKKSKGNHMTKRLVGLGLFVLLSACVKPTSAPAPERNTGTLTILGTPEEEYLQGMVRAFEQETGIHTSYVRLSSGEALARLRDDKGH